MIERLCEYLWNLIPDNVQPRFVGEIPSQSDEGVALTLGGTGTITRFFGSSTKLIDQIVVCNVRTRKFSKGTDILNTVIEALDNYRSEQDNVLGVLLIDGDSYLGTNEEKLHEFQITFKTIVKEE